jgi:membrane protein
MTTPIPDRKDHTIGRFNPQAQLIWEYVSRWPIRSLWDLQGVPLAVVLKRTYCSFLEDNLLSRAAELGFYFLFALFPTLISAASILGIVARGASGFYLKLIEYLALVIPAAAFSVIVDTFNETAAAVTTGKITFGLVAALWSASVGFSAIQDSLNTVYKVKETRPYWRARGSAILVTLLLAIINTIALATLLASDLLVRLADLDIHQAIPREIVVLALRSFAWIITFALITLFFAAIYYFAPDVKTSRWRWFTPGAALGIFGWIVASLALRLYLHYFNTFSMTYGSLGAVIILLTWFYLTGLMLLIGAEFNSEIEAAAAEMRLHATHRIAPEVTAHPELETPPITP